MNRLLAGLLVVALLVIELLCGGRGLGLVLSLPSYAILALAALLSVMGDRRQGTSSSTRFCLLATAVFFGYVLFRIAHSPVEYLARRDHYLILAALIVYLLVALRLTSSEDRSILIRFLLLLALAQAAIGAIQFFKGNQFMLFPFLPRSDQYESRASGFYSSPTHLSGFFEIVLPMALAFASFSRWRPRDRIFAGGVSVVCVAGIVMTGSRGGYLAALASLFAFGILGLLWVHHQHKGRRLVIISAMLAVALAGALAVTMAIRGNEMLRSRLANIAIDGSRRQLAQTAMQQIRLRPWTGTGSGTFLYYGRMFRPDGSERDPEYAHNDYLHFLAEYGILGVPGLLLFLFAHARNGWKTFREASRSGPLDLPGGDRAALTVGALSVLAAYLVHSLSDFNLHIPGNALLMAFVFGLLANPAPAAESSSVGAPPGPPLLRFLPFLIPLLGLWVAFTVVPKFPGEFYNARAGAAMKIFDLSIESFDYKTAERFAEAALRWEKGNPDIYYHLGESKIGLTETCTDPIENDRFHREGLAAHNKGLELFPQDIRLVLCKAWTLDALEEYEAAEPVFRRALELDPKSGYVRCHYAEHLFKWGKLDEAEIRYREGHDRGAHRFAALGLEKIAEARRTRSPESSVPGPAAAPGRP